jgi:hypothetical protein
MQLEQPKPKRIRIEIKEVEYAGDGKTGHKVIESKSMTVYNTTVTELEKVIKKAIEKKAK